MAAKVPRVLPLSRDKIERSAKHVVSIVSPQSLVGEVAFPIHDLCEFYLNTACGAGFAVEQLPEGIEGRFDGNDLILSADVYDQLIDSIPRARFTAAHEIGHLALHRTQLHLMNLIGRKNVQMFNRGELPAFRDPEWQANEYAASLLMPCTAVQALQTEFSVDHVLAIELSDRMNVSLQAATTRINILKRAGKLS